jgi:hypothetical protein
MGVQLEVMTGTALTRAQMEWARCRPWLVEALGKGPGLSSIENIEEGVEACRLVFWAGEKCAWITRIDEWPNAKIMTVCLAGGEMADQEELDAQEHQISYIAANLGCTHVGVESDEASISMLVARGFTHAFTTLLKPIRHNAAQAAPIAPAEEITAGRAA